MAKEPGGSFDTSIKETDNSALPPTQGSPHNIKHKASYGLKVNSYVKITTDTIHS